MAVKNRNNRDSLEKRYFYKLLTNLVSLPISLITQTIVPRGLGPKAYGDFNFLSNFFTQVVNFLDMGTSSCFYTKLSQRPKEPGLISFYLYFIGIVSLGVIGFVILVFLTPISTKIWPGQTMFYIYLAAGLGIITWIVEVFNKMNDAYGLTLPAEVAKIIQRILGMILIILLYIFQRLNLKNFFFYQYLILFSLIIAFIWVTENNHYTFKQSWNLSLAQIRRYINEFYHYTHPLFIYSLVGLVAGILDRWFLQKYSGSIQQGFFGLSYQIAMIFFLFSSAMTPLLMREFSIAFANKDLSQMAVLFRRYIPLFYSITAYFSCFIAIQADKIIHIIGGDKYKGAVTALMIMAFFPLHATYGQLSGSVFFATGQTKLHRNIGVIFMLFGLPIAYFLIAPQEKMGLNAGATGLAIKMVLIQFVAVNTQLYFNAKFLKLSFLKFFVHQLIIAGCLVVAAFIATIVVSKVLGSNENIILNFFLSGILYTSIVITLVYCLPVIFGLKSVDIPSLLQRRKREI